MSEKGDTKLIYEGKTKCPHCGKKIKFGVEKEILTPGVKAGTQIKLTTEKDDQTELTE